MRSYFSTEFWFFETLRLSDTLSHFRTKNPAKVASGSFQKTQAFILTLEIFLFSNGSILETQTVNVVTSQ